ncbi:hypothetical protein BDN67DRAFT_974696 [Paxillus ammoniavirescens]|nr:hypothetical protein BDN67DRAFT_974696 [Paxillus ammoniavirescens]
MNKKGGAADANEAQQIICNICLTTPYEHRHILWILRVWQPTARTDLLRFRAGLDGRFEYHPSAGGLVLLPRTPTLCYHPSSTYL